MITWTLPLATPMRNNATASSGADGASAMKAKVSAAAGAETRSSERLPKRELANPARGEDATAPRVVQASINPSLAGEKWN